MMNEALREREAVVRWHREWGDIHEQCHHMLPWWRVFVRAAHRFTMAAHRSAAVAIERGDHLTKDT